jgi:hypothetical protein
VIKTLKKWHFLMHVVMGLRNHKNGVTVEKNIENRCSERRRRTLNSIRLQPMEKQNYCMWPYNKVQHLTAM